MNKFISKSVLTFLVLIVSCYAGEINYRFSYKIFSEDRHTLDAGTLSFTADSNDLFVGHGTMTGYDELPLHGVLVEDTAYIYLSPPNVTDISYVFKGRLTYLTFDGFYGKSGFGGVTEWFEFKARRN